MHGSTKVLGWKSMPDVDVSAIEAEHYARLSRRPNAAPLISGLKRGRGRFASRRSRSSDDERPATPAAARFIDLFADAVAPLWPNALQDLDRPVIDPDALEIDHEPIAARELDTDAQRSQLRDHLLRLPATLREDLVPPLLPGHGPRLARSWRKGRVGDRERKFRQPPAGSL
jgi:hypothetical protein